MQWQKDSTGNFSSLTLSSPSSPWLLYWVSSVSLATLLVSCPRGRFSLFDFSLRFWWMSFPTHFSCYFPFSVVTFLQLSLLTFLLFCFFSQGVHEGTVHLHALSCGPVDLFPCCGLSFQTHQCATEPNTCSFTRTIHSSATYFNLPLSRFSRAVSRSSVFHRSFLSHHYYSYCTIKPFIPYLKTSWALLEHES